VCEEAILVKFLPYIWLLGVIFSSDLQLYQKRPETPQCRQTESRTERVMEGIMQVMMRSLRTTRRRIARMLAQRLPWKTAVYPITATPTPLSLQRKLTVENLNV